MLFRSFRRCHSLFSANSRATLAYALVSLGTSGPLAGLGCSLLDAMLAVYETQRSALPWASAALAAGAFRLYRERGGNKTAPLPDFFIGAHAAVANLTVLTRDPAPYHSYFGRLKTLGV